VSLRKLDIYTTYDGIGNPSESRVSQGQKVINKGFVPCAKTISTRNLMYNDPLVQVTIVQRPSCTSDNRTTTRHSRIKCFYF
jgi:hypothetical protein